MNNSLVVYRVQKGNIPPSYMLLIINHYEDPGQDRYYTNQYNGTMESSKFFFVT